VFFFKACKAIFLAPMTPLKKILFGLGSLDFGERDKKERSPTKRVKICNHEM